MRRLSGQVRRYAAEVVAFSTVGIRDAGSGDKMRVHLHALVNMTCFTVGIGMDLILTAICGYTKAARDVVAENALVVEVAGT